ncbi:hypothetical protein [Sphingomonas limnosediminicola]
MRRSLITVMVAGAFAVAPAITFAAPPGGAPPGGGAAMHGPTSTTTPTTTQSPTGNGGGYNHLNSPQHATGQPMQSCETTGSPPGNSGTAPGSAFNQDGGTAGSKYAGEQPQNSRNTASVSQYDVACANQPH